MLHGHEKDFYRIIFNATTNCVFWINWVLNFDVLFRVSPRQETTKSLVRKHSHPRVHLNKCIIHFGIFSGKPLIAMCLSKRSHSSHIKRPGLVFRPDSGCALLINNTERGSLVLRRGMHSCHTGYPQTPLHNEWKQECLSQCLREVSALWEFSCLYIILKLHIFTHYKVYTYPKSNFQISEINVFVLAAQTTTKSCRAEWCESSSNASVAAWFSYTNILRPTHETNRIRR